MIKNHLWANLKKTSEKSFFILKAWDEIVGIPKRVETRISADQIYVTFSDDKILVLPFSQNLKHQLHDSVGQRISILHTDIPSKSFLFQKVR